MKSQSVKKLFTLHSWVGVITGVLMFVICFTGAVAVFGQDELRKWSNLDLRGDIAADPKVVEALSLDGYSRVPEEYRHKLQINMPGRFYSDLVLLFESELKTEDGEGPLAYMLRYDLASQGLLSSEKGILSELYINSRESNAGDFIVRFHADLHLGKLGLILTGTLGLMLLASVVTGVIIHRKILAQLFTFRPHKSFSLFLNDGHKQLGVWAVLFHGVIGFTGAFLGLATVILLPAAAYVGFGGDQDKLIETFVLVEQAEISHVYTPTPIANMMLESQSVNNQNITFINVSGYNDANAKTYITVTGTESMTRNEMRIYEKGEFVKQIGNFNRLDGVSGQVLELMFPLHFGNFGGVLIKTIWTFLGLSTALLPLTGLMLWIERGVTSPNPRFSMRTYNRFNRLLLGSCGGVVLACVAVFHAQLILFAINGKTDTHAVMLSTFFGVWFASIVWALIFPRLKQGVSWLLYCAAALLILIMPLNALITQSHILNVSETGHYTTLVIDWVALGLGIVLWRAVRHLTITETAKGKTIKSGVGSTSEYPA